MSVLLNLGLRRSTGLRSSTWCMRARVNSAPRVTIPVYVNGLKRQCTKYVGETGCYRNGMAGNAGCPMRIAVHTFYHHRESLAGRQHDNSLGSRVLDGGALRPQLSLCAFFFHRWSLEARPLCRLPVTDLAVSSIPSRRHGLAENCSQALSLAEVDTSVWVWRSPVSRPLRTSFPPSLSPSLCVC